MQLVSSADAGPAGTGFVALPLPELRAAGVAGRQPRVSWGDGALTVRDEHGACLVVDIAQVRCLRLGATGTSTGKVHMARVFIEGGDPKAPLRLQAANPHDRGYAPVMRRLAEAVASRHGLAAVEHGLGDGDARGLFLWVLAVAIGGSVLAFTVWAERFGTVGITFFVLAMAGIVTLVGREAYFVHRPASLGSLEEVDRYLPR
jgi:hypothetical protein